MDRTLDTCDPSDAQGKRAPSCNFWFNDCLPGDILVHDVMVPDHGATTCTYYCCMQWNAGQNGGGYCGIQDHPDGKCYIFSIWDPTNSNEAIKARYAHPGTKPEPFGGEGTGLKSMNFSIGWKTDQWYTLVARRWESDGHTQFGFWVRDQTGDQWHHLVTMDFPVPKITFDTSTACFIEDWHGNGEKYRRVHFKNGFKRGLDHTWHPFSSAKFNVVQEDACRLYNDNYDGGKTCDECFFLQTGHGTTPCPQLKTDRSVCCQKSNKEPTCPPISFSLQEVTSEKVTWHVPESSTPQFCFTVVLDGRTIAQDTTSETRSVTFNASQGSEVKVVLEDIFGHVTTQSSKV